MAALTKDRDTRSRDGETFEFGVQALQKIFAGAIACIAADGYAVKGSATPGLAAVGIAQELADNSAGADNAIRVKVRPGLWRLANSGANALTRAHIGSACYIEDDQTVGSAPAGRSVAGIVKDLDGAGVWVDVGRLPYPSAHDSYIAEALITTAQLLALNAAPQILVPAPGAGKVNIWDGAQLFLDFNSVAYDGIAAGENLEVRYTNAAGQLIATIETDPFLASVADAYRFARPAAAVEIIPVANAAIVLCLAAGEVATGNSPLKVRSDYRVRDAAW